MAKRKNVRCRKCGKESGGPRGAVFHTCDHTCYDNGASDAIAAVRDKCKACHNGLVRGATTRVPCPYCIPSMDAIRKATGTGNEHLSAYEDGKVHGRMLGVNDALEAVRKGCPDCGGTEIRKMMDEDGCPFDAECTCTRTKAAIREATGVKK